MKTFTIGKKQWIYDKHQLLTKKLFDYTSPYGVEAYTDETYADWLACILKYEETHPTLK